LLPGLPPGSAVVADRSYDSRLVHALIEAAGAQPQIPTPRRRRVQRSVDPALYRQRNLVERFFNKLKHFRRIATRYEKTARNYLAAVLLAAARLWTRFESTA
jgi:transposase